MKKFMLPLLMGAALCVGANASEFDASPGLLQSPPARPSNNLSPVSTGRLHFEDSPMHATAAPGPIDFSVDPPFNPLVAAAAYSGILMPIPGLPAGSSHLNLSPLAAQPVIGGAPMLVDAGIVSPYAGLRLAPPSSAEGYRSPIHPIDWALQSLPSVVFAEQVVPAVATPAAATNPDNHDISLRLPADLLRFIAANSVAGDAGAVAGAKRPRTGYISKLDDGVNPIRDLRGDFFWASRLGFEISSDDASSVTSGTESTSVIAGSDSDSAASASSTLSVLAASPVAPAFHPGAAPKSKKKYVLDSASRQKIIAIVKKVIARNGYKIVKK